MIPSPLDESGAWFSGVAKEACRLAIAAHFSVEVQRDLEVLREAANTYTQTGRIDRAAVESCLERLRIAARKSSPPLAGH